MTPTSATAIARFQGEEHEQVDPRVDLIMGIHRSLNAAALADWWSEYPFGEPTALRWLSHRAEPMMGTLLKERRRPNYSDSSARTASRPVDKVTQELHEGLRTLYQSASVHGWDNEGAPPVPQETYERASRFIDELLLHSIKPPELEPTAQGEVVFSWDSDDVEDSFDVVIQPSGEVAIAGIFQGVRVYGTVKLTGEQLRRIADMASWTDR